jgi:hypothetical protein
MQMTDDVQARDVWHVNINNRNMNPRIFDEIQRLTPVAGLDYAKATSLQPFAHNLAKSLVVIRHKQVRYIHRGVIISNRLICYHDCIATTGEFNSMMITAIAALFTTTT